MAKKDKKKKDTKSAETDTVAALRSAFERTLSASAEGAQATRERTREIVDEIAAAAGRVRNTLEDMRILDEVKRLRNEVETLAARVSSLERPGTEAKSAPATAVKKPAAKRSRAKKPPAAKPAVATKKPAAARKRAASTRKPAAATKKPAAAAKAKPAVAETPKPAAQSGTS